MFMLLFMEIKIYYYYIEVKNMSILNITSDITLNMDASLYFIDATSGNITITITDIAYDYQFYNFIRVDNSVNTVNINLSSCTLKSGESNFNLHGYSNLSLLSNGSVWVPIAGYTKDR